MPTPILIDTDISLGTPNAEIDDGAALLLLAKSPEADIRALTSVHGNAPANTTTANLLRLAGYLDLSHLPIAAGTDRPLTPDSRWAAFLEAWQAQYGPTPPATGPLSPLRASDLIIETARAHPGELVVLALGPLTNLALALQKHPPLTRLVKAVVTMGGSLNDSGQAEFNIRCDPEAARIVFEAGWPLFLHGLEITRRVLFTPQDFSRLDAQDPAQALLHTQAPGWIRIVESQGWEKGGCSLHDAVAAAAVIAPELFSYTNARVTVETAEGPLRGVTRAVPVEENSRVRVATAIDAGACHALILNRIME